MSTINFLQKEQNCKDFTNFLKTVIHNRKLKFRNLNIYTLGARMKTESTESPQTIIKRDSLNITTFKSINICFSF